MDLFIIFCHWILTKWPKVCIRVFGGVCSPRLRSLILQGLLFLCWLHKGEGVSSLWRIFKIEAPGTFFKMALIGPAGSLELEILHVTYTLLSDISSHVADEKPLSATWSCDYDESNCDLTRYHSEILLIHWNIWSLQQVGDWDEFLSESLSTGG